MAGSISTPELAGFSRALATAFSQGHRLVDTLDDLALTTQNPTLQSAIVQIKADLLGGVQLNESMNRSGLFPEGLVKLIFEGEQIGELDKTFDQVAKRYEAQI